MGDEVDRLTAERDRTAGRLSRIAEAHEKYVGPVGLTSGDCNECGVHWPCPTYVWATGDRDPVVACWDPADDEPEPLASPAAGEAMTPAEAWTVLRNEAGLADDPSAIFKAPEVLWEMAVRRAADDAARRRIDQAARAMWPRQLGGPRG